MNPWNQLLATPRSEWSRQLIKDGFDAALDALGGRLHQESSFSLDQATIDPKRRSVNGTANVEEVSRTLWLIRIEGLDIRQYRKNPVVLASHCQYAPGTLMPGAIGTVGSVAKKDKALIFKNMVFDDDPLSEAWFQKIVKQIVRMVSIGFLPIEWGLVEEPPKKTGGQPRWYIEISKSELLEISSAPVGANRGAFIDSGQSAAIIRANQDAEVDNRHQGRLAERIELIEQSLSEIQRLINSKNTTTSQSSDQETKDRLERALSQLDSIRAA